MSNIAGLRPFVEDGRLVKVPAKQWRRHVVLQHIVFESFQTNPRVLHLMNDRRVVPGDGVGVVEVS